MTHVEILATGPELIKKGFRGIEPVVEEIIRKATSEIQILAYVITSNALHILDLLEKAAEKGIKIILIINSLESQDDVIISRLNSLASKFPHVKIFNFSDPEKRQLHAKIIVTDRRKAVIGSANFSWGGMYANYEVGMLIEDEGAWEIAKIVDFLTSTMTPINFKGDGIVS